MFHVEALKGFYGVLEKSGAVVSISLDTVAVCCYTRIMMRNTKANETQTITVGAKNGLWWFEMDGDRQEGFNAEATATDIAIRFCQDQEQLYRIYYTR
jgi:hypothetical protein